MIIVYQTEVRGGDYTLRHRERMAIYEDLPTITADEATDAYLLSIGPARRRLKERRPFRIVYRDIGQTYWQPSCLGADFKIAAALTTEGAIAWLIAGER